MTPEPVSATEALRGLSALMAEYFRDRAVPYVVAEQAGLDKALIADADTVADLWWAVVQRAHEEGKLAALVEVAKGRVGARGAVLEKAYQQVIDAEQPTPKRATSKRSTPPMSDYRSSADGRIDQMLRDMATMQVQIAGLQAQVSVLLDQNKQLLNMLQQQDNDPPPTMTGTQLMSLCWRS